MLIIINSFIFIAKMSCEDNFSLPSCEDNSCQNIEFRPSAKHQIEQIEQLY